ncbi:hypothetical protein AMTR_s00001p00269710 [Amborella trichopoda]|uniref:Uncharacterized protein n=1 Tax=Amborella trichopoda TaxID=13333 RepID=W1NM02_AMBTC|nr:hypothetical protein AMTR_s00001p00269710 [Amborella trichopoda]
MSRHRNCIPSSLSSYITLPLPPRPLWLKLVENRCNYATVKCLALWTPPPMTHEEEDPSDHHRIGFPSQCGSPPAQQLRQLLMTCVEHISHSDLQSAAHILSLL